MQPSGAFRGYQQPSRGGVLLWRCARFVLLGTLLVAALVPGGEAPLPLRLRQLAGQQSFRLLDWQVATVGQRLGRILSGVMGPGESRPTAAEKDAVLRFATESPDGRATLLSQVEKALERQLNAVIREDGITFPPASISLGPPPMALIVSPRDRIAVEHSMLLRPEISAQGRDYLEERVESLGYSALVVPIGGLATYPSMVPPEMSLHQIARTAGHEWVHAYFFFHPLGQAYWSNREARTINETAAELAGEELGARLLKAFGLEMTARQSPPTSREPSNLFQRLMREIRLTVDRLLAQGEVGEAEAYMRERRDWLASQGYSLRKLNQAYFAFYGSYGSDPAAGDSPAPRYLRSLRQQSSSLGNFLRKVAVVTDFQSLAELVASQQDMGTGR